MHVLDHLQSSEMGGGLNPLLQKAPKRLNENCESERKGSNSHRPHTQINDRTVSFKPFKAKQLELYKLSSYRPVNTFHLGYKNQPDPYKRHKYVHSVCRTLYFCLFNQVAHNVIVGPKGIRLKLLSFDKFSDKQE
jgi:hypothetical protein